jgi:hypothetical protein
MAKEPEPYSFGRGLGTSAPMKHPDPKKHQLISFVKSGIRIAASCFACLAFNNPSVAVFILAFGYGLAEIVGVYEELV